jgi:hypothetical protein
MPIQEGTRGLKTWKGTYSFAVDGGAISTITLRSDDGPLPKGSVVVAGYVDVATAPTSGGAATIAVQVEGAGDTVAAAAVSGAPWSTTGVKNVIENATGSTAVKTTAERGPKIVIAAATLTAGVFTVVLLYI